ncbi:hypothetical protein EZS27_026038 [termite gut metagenome]|uniref:G domain-containing protein n=1 Tax=termite gut metagenome TaxID=433724 RepID=A0A5J4QUV8_9ZZZZ
MVEFWSNLLASLAIESGKSVITNWMVVRLWGKKLLVCLKLKRGSTNILVIGRANTGKTVLSDCLKGKSQQTEYELPNTSNIVETEYFIWGKKIKLVKVIPGQDEKRNPWFANDIPKEKKIEGFIYVVDWGYTNARDDRTKQLWISQGLDTIEKLRQFHLEKEIEDLRFALRDIERYYTSNNLPKWIIIAVNKVDLFKDKIDDAQNYYSNPASPFVKEINKTLNTIGTTHIKYKVLPICSFENDFIWNNETVKTDLGGTSSRNQLVKLFKTEIENLL